jgi:hypothetical protein
MGETFSLEGQRQPLGAWLSHYLGLPVTVQENILTGFPDDLNAPGPTLISTATLEAVAQWFPQLDLAEVRRRFRTNLELTNTAPFWEEQLYGESDGGVLFQIGHLTLTGINPCQRCIVPTRSSFTGQSDRTFQRQFVQQRQATLPAWAPRSRFNHFYKLAVNTRLVAGDGLSAHFNLGDSVQRLAATPAESNI